MSTGLMRNVRSALLGRLLNRLNYPQLRPDPSAVNGNLGQLGGPLAAAAAVAAAVAGGGGGIDLPGGLPRREQPEQLLPGAAADRPVRPGRPRPRRWPRHDAPAGGG